MARPGTSGAVRTRLAVLLVVASAGLLFAAPAGAETKSFDNGTALVDEGNDGVGALLPFPSVIDASGMTGTVTSMKVTVRGVAFNDIDELSLLLVGPGGRRGGLVNDVCSGQNSIGIPLTWTLVDGAPALPQTGTCVSGTFGPVSYTPGSNFPYPFPGPQPTGLSRFTGAPASGSWQLYAYDGVIGGQGTIAAGWSLELTTTDAPKAKKCKKAKRKRSAGASAKKKRCKKKKKKR